jgi:hypothetical protein
MPSNLYFGDALYQAALNGTVPNATIDDKVLRILTQMFTRVRVKGRRGKGGPGAAHGWRT